MENHKEEHPIIKATDELAVKYPIEYNHSSRASLWRDGLRDGLVTRELYDEALKFYGDLWHYIRD